MAFTIEEIKNFAMHLKVQGAYVQQPVPGIYGLEPDMVVSSNDANALYPISLMHQNIGYDTLFARIYEPAIIDRTLNLIATVLTKKKDNPEIIDQACSGFSNAIIGSLKDFFTRKTVQNKADMLEFASNYYVALLRKLLEFQGTLEDIFEPKDDTSYFLLRSYLYPILELVTWVSPQNRGYNQTTIDYVFFNHDFDQKYRNKYIYIMLNFNSTKVSFKKLNLKEMREIFSRKIVNPYGVLYDLHDENLAFDVELIKIGLDDRKIIKNRSLMLGAILSAYNKLSEETKEFFLNPENGLYLSERQANQILNEIEDTESREGRLFSLTTIEFEVHKINKKINAHEKIPIFIALREAQFNSMQQGIKVTLNSLYGIYGLITWQFASPIIGNSITTAGKIYGIKLFQVVSTEIISKIDKDIKEGKYNESTEYIRFRA